MWLSAVHGARWATRGGTTTQGLTRVAAGQALICLVELLHAYSNTEWPSQLVHVLDTHKQDAWPERTTTPRPEPRRYSPDERAQVIERYRAGMSTAAIGRELKMHKSSVNYVLKAADIKLRRRGRPTS